MSKKQHKKKRKVEVVVISDTHLGTYGSHAEELLRYLKSIKPKVLILNGDIIDIWRFKKNNFKKAHLQVVKYIIGMIVKGVEVYYITGNHDEYLRRFVDFKMDKFQLVNQLVLTIDGKPTWFFHGDVFDVSMQHARWLVKLGALSYDILIRINRLANRIALKMDRKPFSMSKKIKQSVKSAVSFINQFEELAAQTAIRKGYTHVVCGHIHQAEIRNITTDKGKTITYMNSGDWVESLTALEYNNSKWQLYHYIEDENFDQKAALHKDTEDLYEIAEEDAIDVQILYKTLLSDEELFDEFHTEIHK